MKKVLLVLLAIAIATPAMAAVTLTGTASSTTTAIVGYSRVGDKLPRAFALTLTTDAGTITAVTAAKTGPSTAALPGFGIFPGRITIDGTGNVTTYGTPDEPNSLPGGGLLGTHRVIVALGSLYAASAPGDAPINAANLFTVTVAGAGSLTVTPETTYRGGVVGEDANTITVSPITISFLPAVCLKNKSAGIMADWNTLGQPACWCNAYQCDGDIDGLTETSAHYRVYTGDLNILVSNWKKKIADVTLNPCADIDHIGETSAHYRVYTGDLNILIGHWKAKDAALAGDCATRTQ